MSLTPTPQRLWLLQLGTVQWHCNSKLAISDCKIAEREAAIISSLSLPCICLPNPLQGRVEAGRKTFQCYCAKGLVRNQSFDHGLQCWQCLSSIKFRAPGPGEAPKCSARGASSWELSRSSGTVICFTLEPSLAKVVDVRQARLMSDLGHLPRPHFESGQPDSPRPHFEPGQPAEVSAEPQPSGHVRPR